MKRFATPILIFLISLLFTTAAFGTTYYSVNGQLPSATSSWFTNTNGTGSNPANFGGVDTFVIQSGHTMTTVGAWTLAGASSELLVFGTLTINATSTVNVQKMTINASGVVNINAGNSLSVNSTVGGHDLIVNGTLLIAGSLSYTGGATGEVQNTGAVQYQVNGGTIPLFTWTGNARLVINGITNAATLTGLNQTFREVRWNCPSQTSDVELNSQLTTVNKNLWIISTGTGSIVLFNSTANLNATYLNVDAGTLDFTTTSSVFPTITISETGTSFDQQSGSIIRTSGSGSKGTFVFASGDRDLNQAGTIGPGVGYHFLPGSVVGILNNQITVTGDMTIDSGATFGYNYISNPSNYQSFIVNGAGGNFKLDQYGSFYIYDNGGITTSGLSGSVQVTGTRIFSPYANYFYWGGTMVTGNALPDTIHGNVNVWPTSLTLSKDLLINGSLTIIDSPLNVGSYTLELRGDVIDSLINSVKGYFQSGSSGTIFYNKNSAGQKVLTNNSQYGNLTLNNYPKSFPSGTLYISNTFSPGTANHAVNGSNTININGTGTQPIPGFRYAELNISKSSGEAVFPNSSTDTVHISGTFTAGFSPTYTTTGSTVEFHSSTVSQFTGHFDYHNLVLRNTYAKVAIGALITVNGLLDVGGQGLTLGATNADNASQVIVRAGSTLDLWHANASLTVNDGNGGGYDLIADGTIDNNGSLLYGSGATGLMNGTYIDSHDGGTLPSFTWGTGSSIQIFGVQSATTMGGLNQAFYNFLYVSSGQTSVMNFNSQLTSVAGLFDVQSTGSGSIVLFNTNSKLSVSKFNGLGGTVNFSTTPGAQDTLEIIGSGGPTDFGVSFANLTITGGSGAHGVIHFNGTDQSAFISNAISSDIEILVSKKMTFPSLTTIDGPFIVANGGTLYKSTLDGSGSFELKPGGTIVIDDVNGITESGGTGNIRMSSSRIFSSGGRYIYDGASFQVTGDGLPQTVSFLSENNASGVSLSRSVEVTDTLRLAHSAGALYIGTDTLTIGGTTDGYIATLSAGGGTVIYSSTADGQGVIPTSYYNLLFSDHSKNLNSGTYTILNMFDPGASTDHTIAAGATIDLADGSSLNVPPLRYGNLTISGNRDNNFVSFSNTDTTFIRGN